MPWGDGRFSPTQCLLCVGIIKLSVLVEAATTAQNRSTRSCDLSFFFLD